MSGAPTGEVRDVTNLYTRLGTTRRDYVRCVLTVTSKKVKNT